MNENQIKGTIKEAVGKVQEKTGELIGSTNQQVKGLIKEKEGKLQKKVGDAQEIIEDKKI